MFGRLAAALFSALLVVPFGASPAFAAVPTNDTLAGATAVTSLPTTITEDTSEATTDALDATLNADCGAPFTNASVWFTYTDPTGSGFLVDMSASSYTGGFIVTAGEPTPANMVACGPEEVAARGAAGTTYYILAFSDTATNGGTLTVTFSELPPPPTAALTVGPRGVAYKDGSATIFGTYTCTNADGYSADVEGTLTQQVGRLKINGYFFVSPLQCDGSPHAWAATVVPDNGLFAGGRTTNVSMVFACGLFDCAIASTDATIRLTRAGK